MTFATGYAFRPMTPLQEDKDRRRVAEQRDRARRTTASLARDAEDLRLLLDMLGLNENGDSR